MVELAAELRPAMLLMAVPKRDSTTAATMIMMTATMTTTMAMRTWVKPDLFAMRCLTLFIGFILI